MIHSPAYDGTGVICQVRDVRLPKRRSWRSSAFSTRHSAIRRDGGCGQRRSVTILGFFGIFQLISAYSAYFSLNIF